MAKGSSRARNSRSPKLRFTARLMVGVVGLGAALTGVLWLVFHHFLMKPGDFGLQPNPLEPWWMTLHGAFAFAAIWVLGLLWGIHVTVAWPLSRRRWSGGILAAVTVWLTVSGFLLYYLGDESTRSIVSFLHWGFGLACPVLYLLHRPRLLKLLLRFR